IARECVRFKPDLLIVYEGNNEVVGPFGAGTIFGGVSPPRWLVRAKLWANSLRLGQAMVSVASKFSRGRDDATEWKGMEFFLDQPVPIDDPRLPRVYQSYRENLRDIAATARDAGIHVLFCTAAVNLADCAPFGSRHRSDLAGESREKWQKIYDRS